MTEIFCSNTKESLHMLNDRNYKVFPRMVRCGNCLDLPHGEMCPF